MESTLQDSVEVGTAVAIFTVITEAIGFGERWRLYVVIPIAEHNGSLALLCSVEEAFIGPGLILAGMALNQSHVASLKIGTNARSESMYLNFGGGDGSGKGTATKMVAEILRQEGY